MLRARLYIKDARVDHLTTNNEPVHVPSFDFPASVRGECVSYSFIGLSVCVGLLTEWCGGV